MSDPIDIVKRLRRITATCSDHTTTDKLDRLIARLERAALAQPAAPGWQLVPVEPTPEMLQATIYRVDEAGDEGALLNWRAMLAAAPQAPQPGGQGACDAGQARLSARGRLR